MRNYPQQCDVLVIGGGPAGSMAASLLAKKDYHVVLFEKQLFPREQVGESILPLAWKFCKLIGVEEKINAAKFVQKAGGYAFNSSGTRKIDFSKYGYTKAGLHVERSEFDNILLEHSAELGCDVYQQTIATQVIPGLPYAQVHYKSGDVKGTIKARYVIDCSGQSALVGKQEGFREYDKDFRFVGMWGYYENGRFLDKEGNSHPQTSVVDIPAMTLMSQIDQWSWSWHIALRKSTSVGIVLTMDRYLEEKKKHKNISELYQSAVSETPYVNSLMEGANLIDSHVNSIRDFSYKPNQLYVENCFLSGDSAAFVDPVNSAGVIFGMYSSFLVATFIDGLLKNNASLDYYQKMYDSMYKSRLDIYRLLAFPQDNIDIKDFALGKKYLEMYSNEELKLMFDQAMLVNRSKGIRLLLEEMNWVDDIGLTNDRIKVPELVTA